MIDFPIARMHEKKMRFTWTSISLSTLCFLFFGGCMHLNRPQVSSPAQQKSAVSLAWLSNPLTLFHPFTRKPLPPKAVALLTVGTIRTISNDGSYVIAELEPGIMVTAGTSLLVTANGEETAHLKVAEITPPYFVAEIATGHPEPGEPLRQ
jgi:hypothetical protein